MQIKHLPENEYAIIMGLSSDDGVGIYTKNPEAIPWKRNGWNWGAQDTAFRFTPTLCPRTITDTIYVKGDVTVNVLGNDTTFCPGGELQIGTHYPGTDILWNTGETTSHITVEEAGMYTIQMHYGPGDCFLYDTILIETNEADVFANVLGNDTTLCYGDSLPVEINYTDTMYSIIWNTADTSQTIIVTDAGNYAIEIEYESGCSLYDTIAVNYSTPLIIESTTTPATGGEPNGTITVTVSGGTVPYTYTWSDGLEGTAPDSLYPAIYYLTVTDALNCTAETSIAVSVGNPVSDIFEENIIVYPNPFQDKFIIKSKTAILQVQLSTINAKALSVAFIQSAPDTFTISTAGLPPGLYILKITTAENVMESFLLVKHE